MAGSEEIRVESTIGEVALDSAGSPIGAARMNPDESHLGVHGLLKSVIDESSKEAWEQIKAKIDYTYNNLHYALQALDEETGFSKEVKSRIDKGKKLLFKPNLVWPRNIDPITHDKGEGNTTCSDWPFVAALMRWFHDKLGISYYQMAVGEAATAMSSTAGLYNLAYGGNGRITTEAVIEGRSGEFYGGWGFYFVRRYLAESHDPSHKDDPISGYEDSLAATYLPPGRATDRLMVYDLNRVEAEDYRGRDIPVSDGANFKEITLHKVVVGGDPKAPADLRDYPGCVLVNTAKLKVHGKELITNAIKNIGIGLYPMEVGFDNDQKNADWKYSFPHRPVPGIKRGIPHARWQAELDRHTGLPMRDERGEYLVSRTAGMQGTMVDVVKAVRDDDTFILHISDAITAINLDHGFAGKRVPEGYVFASLDPVALDLLCARYVTKRVPVAEARKIQKEKRLTTDFINRMPMPRLNGKNIETEDGFDGSVARYTLFDYAQGRGLGQRQYHVVGEDRWEGGRLASVQGHLGRVQDKKFTELMTTEWYYSYMKPLWDMQAAVFAWADANDKLFATSYKKQALETFDENGDGIIDYMESGRRGGMGYLLELDALQQHIVGTEKYGLLRGPFFITCHMLKGSQRDWNRRNSDFLEGFICNTSFLTALQMSTEDNNEPDRFFPSISWGRGDWPSIKLARHVSVGARVYGADFPKRTSLASLYGYAFQYADKVFNNGGYTGSVGLPSGEDALDRYLKSVNQGAGRLPFTLYVPIGYGKSAGVDLPNVEETEDSSLVFCARFNGGTETWGDRLY